MGRTLPEEPKPNCLGPPYPVAVALEVVLPGRKAMLSSPDSIIGEHRA
jgi:hypothetical protein